jgi:hypothetical protein
VGRFADVYIDRLLARSDYDALVELQGILWSWPGRRSERPDYAFPSSVFVFVEVLGWFAQAERSGTWTYYEGTPIWRQEALRDALKLCGPDGYAAKYAFGMAHWKDINQAKLLDEWIAGQQAACWLWLRQLLEESREVLRPFYT